MDPEYLEKTRASATCGIIRPRPFVKWAGGKGQLVEQLAARMPGRYSAYHEPFVGGGALFFHLTPKRAFLSDLNEELVNAFLVVKNDCESLLRRLRQYKNSAEFYYEIRALDPKKLDSVERASRFIYLNKTCYNGLYRVNRQGRFNVPFGRYKNPVYADEVQLRLASQALQHADIRVADFEIVLDRAEPGDFVYFDPPYQPISDTSNFTSYTADAFDESQQRRLATVFRELDKRGCHVMLSNSDSPVIRDLYGGFRIETVMAKRYINCKGDRRGAIPEALVLNY
ncbi:MAG: DNA adenine methylase [Firmicutes bacterium]|jgi:DNA adenine methylase|nr:DNA adenine methylase [Bacillota bacterium]